jgi:3-hydroxyisobutyrate dehydrogenase-like beta-hydroxyacid dehydrogenase
MAQRLLDVGFPVTVYNRTAHKAAPIVACGARLTNSAAEGAAQADVVVLSLSDEAAVEQVLFGDLAESLRPGTLIVDTSTVSPSYARQAAERVAAVGARRVEACVLGNPLHAREGNLKILTAGAQDDVNAVEDVLQAIGHTIIYLGPTGMASTMKLVFNLLLGAQLASLAEAVAYGEQAGLDRDMLLTAIASSGFSSRVMAFRAEFMQERRYEPAAFRARLMEKDLRLAIAEASKAGAAMPVVECTAQRFAEVVKSGDGDKDAAVILELQRTP